VSQFVTNTDVLCFSQEKKFQQEEVLTRWLPLGFLPRRSSGQTESQQTHADLQQPPH